MIPPDDNKTSQTIIAKEGSTVKNVIQAIIHIPARTWIMGILIFSVFLLLISAVSNFEPLQALIPTSTTISPAIDGEYLIIIADFEDRSDEKNKDLEIPQDIFDKLVSQTKFINSNVRIERLHHTIDDNAVENTAEIYNATMIVWGWYDALTLSTRITKFTSLDRNRVDLDGGRLSLDNLENKNKVILQSTYSVLLNLALAEIEKDKFENALSYLDNAISSVKSNNSVSLNPSEAFYYRGLIYKKEGRYTESIQEYTNAIDLNPTDAHSYYDRGLVFAILGHTDNAIKDFEKVLEIARDLELRQQAEEELKKLKEQ